jgi:tetratricopeptide (TPR) repeat protein
MSKIDYSKWDELENDFEAASKQEDQLRRMANKEKYLKEREEKQRIWLEQQKKEGKDVSKYEAMHAKNQSELATNGHSLQSHKSSTSCGCGYVDPEELKRIDEERKRNPPESLEVKNVKKLKAIDAAKEHGGILFKEGNIKESLAVYERGIMICNGTYGLSDVEQEQLYHTEMLLNLNIAACHLKLEEWTSAVSACKQALQIQSKNPKAYYRLGQAYIGLGEYEQAQSNLRLALELLPSDAGIKKELDRCIVLEQKANKKAKETMMKMGQQLSKMNMAADSS